MYPILLIALLFVPFTAYGIGYGIISEPFVVTTGDTIEASVVVIGEPGQTLTVKASDDMGADMLVLPDNVLFEDSDTAEILFSIVVPDQYDDGQYTPYILATLEGDKSHQVRINQQAKIKIPINVMSESDCPIPEFFCTGFAQLAQLFKSAMALSIMPSAVDEFKTSLNTSHLS